MTPNGKQTLEIMADLKKSGIAKPTANQITKKFKGLPRRISPVMTVSSYLTHLQREGCVVREASSDKSTAWWTMTRKGEEALHA